MPNLRPAADRILAPSALFHLVAERGSDSDSPSTPTSVPGSTVSAWISKDGRLEPVSSQAPTDSLVYLEPVLYERRPRLLLIDQGKHAIRINDQKAPAIALLNIGDHFRLSGGPAIEIALFHKVRIGTPLPASIGQTCPVCLIPIQEDTRIYDCPSCGLALHLEEHGEDRLECALAISDCPHCGSPIRLADGYQLEPDFLKQ